LGLINDWEIFCFYQRDITLFTWHLSFDNFYPRIVEALTVPVFLLVVEVICHSTLKERFEERKGPNLKIDFWNLTISILILLSLISGFVWGFYFEVGMLLIFLVIVNISKIYNWLQAAEME